jgi:diguanylate cyclase (GGDEF)-like protein
MKRISAMTQNKRLQMQAKINQFLLRYSHDKQHFAQKLKRLADNQGNHLYASLLFTMAHLEFSNHTAWRHWQKILMHWDRLNLHMQREIDVRVAILDYFMDISRKLKNPKIIEIKTYQRTQMETFVDELTQLNNYRYFIKKLKHEIIRANRYRSPLTLVILDVDDFKKYNDTNGHLAGNKALKKLAKIIKKSLRNVDTVTRFGGEEFALLLPATDENGGLAIAERIRRQVEKVSFINEQKQPLKKFTISGGVSTLNEDTQTEVALIQKADQALYRSKAAGKNRILVYHEERRRFARLNSSIKNLLVVFSEQGDKYIPQNISEGGILFFSRQALPLGKNLRLLLNFSDRKNQIALEAQIRRVEPLHNSENYNIGASIVQISETEKRVVKKFLSTLNQK